MALNPQVRLDFDWVTIPAGEFLRGSDKSKDSLARDREMPQRRIYLSEYQIARVPVTNAQYMIFVHEQYKSQLPRHWKNGNIPAGKSDHPVINLSWYDTIAFCNWAGVRLPTEAEWEKAARGTEGRIYPWGNQPPDAKRYNFNSNTSWWAALWSRSEDGTTPVGSYPDGASPYDVMDMAGNHGEWVNDWFDPNYYAISPERNPLGPATGKERVFRGTRARSAGRGSLSPYSNSGLFGFRCVRSS